MMPNITAVQSEVEQSEVYASMKQSVEKNACEVNGMVFIYSAGGPSNAETQVRGILDSESGLDFEVWSGKEPGSIAVLFPGQALDTVHFEGLRLKLRLQERIANYRPQVAVAGFAGQEEITLQVLQQLEEAAKQNYSDDIHILRNTIRRWPKAASSLWKEIPPYGNFCRSGWGCKITKR
ncbi:hypothetical protein HMSSN036_10100 [Paenibacillus macerans]|nr:hypothetical protein HMSSN036_10100 [Paenibacillus macerans]